MAIHGGCGCGAVRYVLARDELPPVYCCHCRDCQSRTGSAFAETAVVGASELEVTGPQVTLTNDPPSGAAVDQCICGTCSSPVFTATSAIPDKVLLRAGSLDDSDSIVPVTHIWTSRKQPWVTLPGDVPVYEEAPAAEFMQLVGYA